MKDRGRQLPRKRSAQRRLQKKRDRRRRRRLFLSGRKVSAPAPIPAYRPRGILEFYAEHSSISPGQIRRRRHGQVTIPAEFSFTDNPEESLVAIKGLVKSALSSNVRELEIDHAPCTNIGPGAQAVASVLGKQAYDEHAKGVGGPLPQDPNLRKIILSTGMPKAFGVSTETPEFEVFDLQWGRKPRTNTAHGVRRDQVPGDFVSFLQRCLQRFAHPLPHEATRCATLVSEFIENAERHSTRAEWWIAAYLHYDRSAHQGQCHLTVFNFGQSIAASIRSVPTHSQLAKEIRAKLKRHGAVVSSEALSTLYALQGRVSRFNPEIDPEVDVGQGTATIIEAFEAFSGDRNAKMCILSGHTHIIFDGTYRIERDEQGNRVIAFNSDNRLDLPPDTSYVRRIRERFPGTLLSVRFVLDKENLVRCQENH